MVLRSIRLKTRTLESPFLRVVNQSHGRRLCRDPSSFRRRLKRSSRASWQALAPLWTENVAVNPPLPSPIALTIPPGDLGTRLMWTRQFIVLSTGTLIRKTIGAGVEVGVGVGAEDDHLNAVLNNLLHLVERVKEEEKGEGSDYFPWAC